MSHSLTEADQEKTRELERANKTFGDMLRRGRSYSGSERNCVFLNTAGQSSGPFANISATSGIDLPDDGRALVATDWDHDGDLDVWISNRNAPRLRFFKNDTPTQNHHLSLRLLGTAPTTNRDAIGARVEVTLANQLPLIKSLQALFGLEELSDDAAKAFSKYRRKLDRMTAKEFVGRLRRREEAA